MQVIQNQENQRIAFIRNNIIFQEGDEQVIGIKIGDCFFGKSPRVVGKIINGFIYTLEGEIIGQSMHYAAPNEKFATKEQLTEAWAILSSIDDHACPWITITENWSARPLHEHLI
jgi:NDP-sugar pyrophosphorylase family protein